MNRTIRMGGSYEGKYFILSWSGHPSPLFILSCFSSHRLYLIMGAPPPVYYPGQLLRWSIRMSRQLEVLAIGNWNKRDFCTGNLIFQIWPGHLLYYFCTFSFPILVCFEIIWNPANVRISLKAANFKIISKLSPNPSLPFLACLETNILNWVPL